MAKMITIDPDKLEKALEKHGLNKNDVSESLGYSRRYITDAIRREKLSSNAIAGISVLFNIDPKLYIKEEKSEEPEESTDGHAYFDFKAPEDLTPYTEPDRKAIEDEVWNFVKMLEYETCVGDLVEMYEDEDEIYMNYTYQEVKAKYEAWRKQKDEIRVGDEVEYECCETIIRFVVCGIDNDVAYGFKYGPDFEGLDIGEYCEIDELKKTGRHFDEIEELLKKIGDSDED